MTGHAHPATQPRPDPQPESASRPDPELEPQPESASQPRAGQPRRRRDAQRNRELLVGAAHAVFTEQGLEAPVDVIARRAGVGNATFYRHFPTRAALVDAVFHNLLTDTMSLGERARSAPDAWTGLARYFQAVFASLAADRGANDLMTTHLEGVEALRDVHAHNRHTVDVLLARGREEGTVRADVTTEDVLFALAALGRAVPALVTATTPDDPATPTPPTEAWRRPLALFLDSLRPAPAAQPLPLPALTEPQLADTLRGLGPHRATTTPEPSGKSTRRSGSTGKPKPKDTEPKDTEPKHTEPRSAGPKRAGGGPKSTGPKSTGPKDTETRSPRG